MRQLGYRPCVGVMLVNNDGKVFVGKRIEQRENLRDDDKTYWQMPQGGIDDGEDVEPAMWRELHEETGVTPDNATILQRMAEDIAYDLPPELVGKLWGGKYRGQMQSWYLVRFTGQDADIDLEAHDPPEFCEWRWVDPETIPDLIVPFKKRVYRAILEEFRAVI